jgi:hypothetical protein
MLLDLCLKVKIAKRPVVIRSGRFLLPLMPVQLVSNASMLV